MDKQTQNLLMIGAGLAVAYYLYTQQNSVPGSAATQEEEAQSAASTLSANLADVLGTS